MELLSKTDVMLSNKINIKYIFIINYYCMLMMKRSALGPVLADDTRDDFF